MGKETFSTIGIQKQTNYALQEMTREAFIAAVTDGLTQPPPYFLRMHVLIKMDIPALMK